MTLLDSVPNLRLNDVCSSSMTWSTKALSYDYLMTSIGLVASQNGLGHARRLSNLAVGFKQLNLSVKLFISLFQYKALHKEFEYSNRKIEIGRAHV